MKGQPISNLLAELAANKPEFRLLNNVQVRILRKIYTTINIMVKLIFSETYYCLTNILVTKDVSKLKKLADLIP